MRCKTTSKRRIRSTEQMELKPVHVEQLQKILDLMQFQSKMPANPFMDKHDAYESVGCGPRAALYIFAH